MIAKLKIVKEVNESIVKYSDVPAGAVYCVDDGDTTLYMKMAGADYDINLETGYPALKENGNDKVQVVNCTLTVDK